jgi:hypothetical protein
VDDFSTDTRAKKIGIGGIKFSEELVHLVYQTKTPNDNWFSHLISNLSESRINIPFACSSFSNGRATSTFCIATHDFTKVTSILKTLGVKEGDETAQPRTQLLSIDYALLKVTQSIGTLTLFPHRRSFSLVGQVVTFLEQAGITVHSFCTSISALAINIDYILLDSAIEALNKLVELPENHAPFRPEFTIKQVPAER